MNAMNPPQCDNPQPLKTRIVAARRDRNNPPIVLLHGWASSSRTWEPVIGSLSEEHDLVLVDLPGFGENTSVPFAGLPVLLEQLSVLLPDACYLLGWSLGGMIATQLALAYPKRVKKLVTLACNASFIEREDWPVAMSAKTFDTFCQSFSADADKTYSRFCALQAQGDSNRKSLLLQLKASAERPGESWRDTLACLGDIRNQAELSSLSQPCLHLFGEKDALVPVEAAQRFIECGPQHQVEVFSGTGHALHLSHPQAVAEKIIYFLMLADNAQTDPYKKSKRDIANSFSRAAGNYESVAVLQKKVANHLISLGPEYAGDIADLGCGTGFCAGSLAAPGNNIFALDLAQGMLATARQTRKDVARWLAGDMECLPFAAQSLNGIVSSMSIQWCENIDAVFAEVRRVLKPGGWFLFSTLGPNTLCELATAWKIVDQFVHVNRFYDDTQIHNQLREQKLVVERAEKKVETLLYDGVLDLMRDLKTLGAHNINAGQNPGLTGRKKIHGLQHAYERFRDGAGKLPATYDVYYFMVRKGVD